MRVFDALLDQACYQAAREVLGSACEIMTSPSIDVADLEQRTLATERLLSTLIAILSAREPRLLKELQAVFASPDFAADEAGRAAAATWLRISRELSATGRLVDSLGADRSH